MIEQVFDCFSSGKSSICFFDSSFLSRNPCKLGVASSNSSSFLCFEMLLHVLNA
ncbi:hypothetical protein D9M71_681250 [compost metagenome]